MIRWFHGLKVSQKLMLIGFFFMIPDSIMLYLFITEINANIAVARLEQAGNAYQRPLERLLDLVPRHRVLAREALSGDAAARGQLAGVAAEIDAAFDALETVDGRLGAELEFTPDGLAKHNRQGRSPRAVRREWDRLAGQMDGILPAERDACDRNHLKLIADLRTMIAQAGDVSNLILDPDIDSYYLMDVTLLALPQTQDRLAQVMADGTDLLRVPAGAPAAAADLRIKLAVGLAELRTDDLDRIVASTGVSLNDNKQGGEMGGVCDALLAQVPPALADYVAAAKRFDDLADRIQTGPPGSVTAVAYLTAGAAARDASDRYWQVAVDQLDAVLQNRIDCYTWRRTRSLGVAAGAFCGAVLLVTFITRSITNPLRRRAEQAVAEGEARVARITANVPGMVYQYRLRPDGTTAFTFVGDGARDLFGLEPDALRADAKAFLTQVEPVDLAVLLNREVESAATLQPWKWEGRVRHAQTGAVRWVAGTSRPARQPDGATLWDGVMTDVTAIKVAESAAEAAAEAAEAASVAKSDFLANMSHEIRTPLNGVVGMAELLAATPLSAQQARYVDVIRSSSDALLSLINDILDFSKIEAGKVELEEADFDLHRTVEEVATLLAPKAAAKGLELACDVDPAVAPHVRGDGGHLRQVVTNLVSNAIKFTAQGEVLVRVTVDEPAGAAGDAGPVVLRFAVTDTGIGIPPEGIDRLFKVFSQVDASTTRRFGGTGLGLAISKQLVELMGGRIGVQSEPGKGSTFWFTVPLRRPTAAPAAPHSLSGRRVLVAEPNPTQRRILQNQLTAWGARVSAVASGRAAVDLARAEAAAGQPFAVAVVDADLPDLAGAALVAAVRDGGAARDLPLILTCGVRARIDPADAAAHGFAAGLPKPVRQSHLFDAVIAAVVALPPVASAVTLAAATAVDARPNRILLVEDVEVNQFIATEMLARGGYTADVASNGREAVEAVARRPYDLVLMDCQMPEMSGFEAAAAIRRREQQVGQGGRVPIIALTANALAGDRERCLAAGMDDYLTKPLSPTDLLRVVQGRLGPDTPGERARAA